MSVLMSQLEIVLVAWRGCGIASVANDVAPYNGQFAAAVVGCIKHPNPVRNSWSTSSSVSEWILRPIRVVVTPSFRRHAEAAKRNERMTGWIPRKWIKESRLLGAQTQSAPAYALRPPVSNSELGLLIGLKSAFLSFFCRLWLYRLAQCVVHTNLEILLFCFRTH